MKKIVLTTVCAVAITGAAFAQGTVSWVSSAMTAASITTQTNATTISPFFGGGAASTPGTIGSANNAYSSYYYALLYTSFSGSQATIGSLSSLFSWNDSGLMATNQNTAGRLNPTVPTTSATVPWAAGTTDSIVLVGWSANLGTTWGAVSNVLANWNNTIPDAYFGVSTTGYMAAGSANPGTTLFATAANAFGLPINSLNTQLYLLPTVIIPEPATMALAGLGGLSLLLFRRQRK